MLQQCTKMYICTRLLAIDYNYYVQGCLYIYIHVHVQGLSQLSIYTRLVYLCTKLSIIMYKACLLFLYYTKPCGCLYVQGLSLYLCTKLSICTRLVYLCTKLSICIRLVYLCTKLSICTTIAKL